MNKIRLFVGCYTKSPSASGIKILDFDTTSYEFTKIGEIKTANASFLHVRHHYLFVVNEGDTFTDSISSYDISVHEDAKLIGKISSFGAAPCFISCDRGLNHLFAANYNGGNLVVFSLDQHGSFIKLDQNIQMSIQEQQISHMHAAVLSNDERFLLVANLGLDTVTVYPYDCNQPKPLDESSAFVFQFNKGTGPRHLILSDDDRYVYVAGELNASINVLKWDNGKLINIQSENLMPNDYSLLNSAADLHFTPNGRFLYVSNRGDANQLIKYSVDKYSGRLKFCSRFDSLGKGPRNFSIDPTGEFLFVAHQYTNDISVFRNVQGENEEDLVAVGKITVEAPVFVKII